MGLREHLDGLKHLWDRIEATDAAGSPLPLDEACRQFMRLVLDAAANGHRLYFIGNGGSAAIASHQAVDYWRAGGIPALAFNDPPLLTCMGNDFGYDEVFARPLHAFVNPGDVVAAISSSGKSPNILNGVAAARERNARIVTLSGFTPENPLRRTGEVNFFVPSDQYGYVEVTHVAILHGTLDLIAKSPHGPRPT